LLTIGIHACEKNRMAVRIHIPNELQVEANISSHYTDPASALEWYYDQANQEKLANYPDAFFRVGSVKSVSARRRVGLRMRLPEPKFLRGWDDD
jgi:hypothetical protein